MASKVLPLLLLGAGALILAGRKKKSAPTAGLPPMVAPPTKGKSGTSTWKKRQQALVDAGFDVGPSGVDGKPGPSTRAAIRAFQELTGIETDGKWGAQTAAAMAIALENALRGLGKASYAQIGSMLSKFDDIFSGFFGDKEENVGDGSTLPQYAGSGWTGWTHKDIFPTADSFLAALDHLDYGHDGSLLSEYTKDEVSAFQGDYNEVLKWFKVEKPEAFGGYSSINISGLIDPATVGALWEAKNLQDAHNTAWPAIVAQTQG